MNSRPIQTTHACPKCDSELTCENGLLRCETHGSFFAYGPHLLVRAPRLGGRSADATMPWEGRRQKTER